MSRSLGYPFTSNVRDATRHPAPAEPTVHGSVTTADSEESEEFVENSGWEGRVVDNKFTGSIGPQPELDAASDEAQRLAAQAGLPYFTPARLAEIAAQLQDDPRLDALKAALMDADNDPEQAARRAWAIAREVADDAVHNNIDVWALLILALRYALNDQAENLRYDLERLEMYGAMAAQMASYSTVLRDTQQALDIKMAEEKDNLKRAFLEVPMTDQREYGQDSFFALTPAGTLHYKQVGVQPQSAPGAAELQALDAAHTPIWKFGFGKVQQWFRSPDGKKWLGYGDTEAERRNNVIAQMTQKYQSTADAANVVSASGLGLRIQIFTHQREQLQKLTEKWQNRFQTDHEVKNQTAAAITSVLKHLHEMQTATTRNLQ